MVVVVWVDGQLVMDGVHSRHLCPLAFCDVVFALLAAEQCLCLKFCAREFYVKHCH